MGSKLVRTLAILALSLAVAGAAFAGTPDPALSTVPNVVVSPGGVMSYVVTVVSAQGPVDGALVQLSFSTEAAGLVCWCQGQTQPLIEATSDASGLATFNISAGGCIDPSLVSSPPAVTVYANGFVLKEVGVVSVDAVDGSGLLPTDGWAPGGICTAGLTDATFHTPAIANGFYSFCTDINSDGACNLDDAVAITPGLSAGWTCTQQ